MPWRKSRFLFNANKPGSKQQLCSAGPRRLVRALKRIILGRLMPSDCSVLISTYCQRPRQREANHHVTINARLTPFVRESSVSSRGARKTLYLLVFGKNCCAVRLFLNGLEHVNLRSSLALSETDISIFICYIDCSPRCTLGNRLTKQSCEDC